MAILPKIDRIMVLFVLLAFAACKQQTQTVAAKTDVKITVKTAPVFRGEITDTIFIFGELALRQEAWLSSQFDGRLTEFSMLRGDNVKKGDRVGVIIPAGREALLQTADSISDEYKPLLAQQENSISLICPISGMVLQVIQHTGDVVSKGGHIAQIGDLSTLDVQGELPVQFLEMARKAKELKVEFTNFSNSPLFLPIETFTGEVSANQSLIVRLKLDNSSFTYRPGMRVRISFPAPAHADAILAPRQALVEEEGEYFLFTVANGKVQKQKVDVGIMKDDIVEIISGVEESQQVAVEKAYSLKDNMEVITR
ncbi:efflux RND transporter periplasmic adaptor subunit [Draconibacterium orientale]|jgi:multidrug efflux pump subunit AcrA (membrane-fusion protein)|uniref:efflux RND transporter periplasmic adaptor subunit n=1 Tax=Draconibacterium orientale TaxID=1168034 RepID=UPI002A0A6134|nr:efflux RND transporter periplasmic adaptor subunit [Draconibacterium orientale]